MAVASAAHESPLFSIAHAVFRAFGSHPALAAIILVILALWFFTDVIHRILRILRRILF